MNEKRKKPYGRPVVRSSEVAAAPALLVCTGQLNCADLGFGSEPVCCQPDESTCGDCP